jgi:Fis family transcriptional regulator
MRYMSVAVFCEQQRVVTKTEILGMPVKITGNLRNSMTREPRGQLLENSGDSELSACVRKMMKQYFKDLDGEDASNIYDMVVANVERPLLEVVMHQARGNQTRAADLLGLNRNTLRKKLSQHGIE